MLDSPTREGFFAQGAVKFVDAGDWVSLELDGYSRRALEHARAALLDRWAAREVEIEFRPFGLISGWATEILEDLSCRLGEIQHPSADRGEGRIRRGSGGARPTPGWLGLRLCHRGSGPLER